MPLGVPPQPWQCLTTGSKGAKPNANFLFTGPMNLSHSTFCIPVDGYIVCYFYERTCGGCCHEATDVASM